MDTHSALTPYQWYNRGIGSFHALHAIVALLVLCRKDTTAIDIAAVARMVRDCLARFTRMAELSSFCTKTLPLLQAILREIESLIRKHPSEGGEDRLTEQRPIEGQGCRLVRPAGAGVPQIDEAVGVGDERHNAPWHEPSNALLLDDDVFDWVAMLTDMQPQQWLSPSTFPLENCTFSGS